VKTFVSITLALVTVGAAATASAAAPAWCKGSSFSGEPDLRILSREDAPPDDLMLALAHATCAPTAEAEANRASIDQARAAWGKRMGMTEADWADMVAFADANGGRNTKVEYSTKDFAQFTPIDQYKAIVDGFEQGGGNGSLEDPIYNADALEGRLSEVGRFAWIRECLKAETSVTSKAPPAATWALCQADIEKFNLQKFGDDLRGDGAHPGDVKMKIRFEARNLERELKEHAERVQAAWKLDPVYKQMFDVAAAGRKEWEGGLGKNKALLDLALQMDAAFWGRSRKMSEGCEAKTAAALATAVGKIPASTFKAMKDERFDPFGGFVTTAGPLLMKNPEINLAATAYVLCQPKTGTGDFLATYLDQTVGYRGPRTAAFSKMLEEKLTLDDMNEKIYWPETRRPYRRVGGTMGSAGGVVASTKMDGNFVVVSLEKLIIKQNECIQSHRTGRLARILPDGTLEYETVCDKMGIVSHDKTWADFKIRKEFAPLLKKGVKFSSVNSPDGEGADVVVTWPSKNTDVPNWLVGAEIK
jgi:hypothetical protein